jgi:hypothetical protein
VLLLVLLLLVLLLLLTAVPMLIMLLLLLLLHWIAASVNPGVQATTDTLYSTCARFTNQMT